jgi:hypothetical protein
MMKSSPNHGCAAHFLSDTIDCNKISLEFVDGLVHIACNINGTVNDDRGGANGARLHRWKR